MVKRSPNTEAARYGLMLGIDAEKLLGEATRAKKDEVAYRRWVDSQKANWNSYWQSRYEYQWQWQDNGWYYRDGRY